MILLCGLKPDTDIRIEFSGIRPGEKLCEKLSAYEEDTLPTQHSQIRVLAGAEWRAQLYRDAGRTRVRRWRRDREGAVLCMQELIPEYDPSTFVLGRAVARAG